MIQFCTLQCQPHVKLTKLVINHPWPMVTSVGLCNSSLHLHRTSGSRRIKNFTPTRYKKFHDMKNKAKKRALFFLSIKALKRTFFHSTLTHDRTRINTTSYFSSQTFNTIKYFIKQSALCCRESSIKIIGMKCFCWWWRGKK